ncbi:hypothetical protein VP01_990g4 [Puccinia sorghi]|uniref:Uncharacterized protein n=1 Tax=Puccinia sorghi TaxID=27349 RepID=A0A0L6U5E6_9BASI|nr:hypothetical protein VP01_990g4 [Puccinia sorghi]
MRDFVEPGLQRTEGILLEACRTVWSRRVRLFGDEKQAHLFRPTLDPGGPCHAAMHACGNEYKVPLGRALSGAPTTVHKLRNKNKKNKTQPVPLPNHTHIADVNPGPQKMRYLELYYYGVLMLGAVATATGAMVDSRGTTKHTTRRHDYLEGTYEANSRVMPEVCPGATACLVQDSQWPSNGFACPEKPDSYGVPDYSFRTAEETAMAYGGGDAITAKEWPSSCELPAKGSKMMKYSNGLCAWTAIYSITPTCNCPSGVEPRCSGGPKGLSNDTCNVAVLNFCEMRSGTDLCHPK